MFRHETSIGWVTALWRYPVKSMLGEELEQAEVTLTGIVGDRAYALIDVSTGNVVSAKNPRKWQQLLQFHSAFSEARTGAPIPSLRITLPDGAVLSSEQSDISLLLSRLLGRDVELVKRPPKAAKFEEYSPDMEGLAHRDATTSEKLALAAPTGTFFDLAPVHLLTTATLRRLAELEPDLRLEVPRFRPNIVVETVPTESSFVENSWVGRVIAIGESVRFSIVIPCPRCVMTTLPQRGLSGEPNVLRAVARHNRIMIAPLGKALASVGVYATVIHGGTVHRGDPVRLLGATHFRRAAVIARAYWRMLSSG
jgi:uncharacterized protein